MSMHIYVMDINVKPEKLGCTTKYISSPKELEYVIDKMHKSKICNRCASSDSV